MLSALRSMVQHSAGKVPTASTLKEQPKAGRGPRVNKAGLLVTDELQQAMDRCSKKVKKLAEECRRSNRKFRDTDFDLLDDRDICLHGLSGASTEKFSPTEALRVSQIFDDPQFFVDGATASDIAQGSLGNCWFLSALAVVATAGLIPKICVERDEKVGIYGFVFWRDAGWVDVIIDDLLFIDIPKWRDLSARERALYKNDQEVYAKAARKGSKILYFGKSMTENETWVPLIEKAYAKLHGDYAAISGGWTHEGVEDMTGAVSEVIYSQDILDPDLFWTSELLLANTDRAFACGEDMSYFPGPEYWNDNRENQNNIVLGHAYSVIKAVEYNGKKFLRVRNPWGKTEWTGAWSDGSKEWTEEWFPAQKVLEYKFGNDGEFIMEYSDFLNQWSRLDKCRYFNDDWAISQLWLRVNCGDFPNPVNYGHVSFTVSLSKPSPVVFVLAQLDTRYFQGLQGQYGYDLEFAVYKAGEDIDQPIQTSRMEARWRRSVSLELDMDKGEYVVQVKIDRAQVKDNADVTISGVSEKRKLGQKHAEKLFSSSIAANFNAAAYGSKMPLSPDTFRGLDLASLQISMQQSIEERRETRREAFKVKEKDERIKAELEKMNPMRIPSPVERGRSQTPSRPAPGSAAVVEGAQDGDGDTTKDKDDFKTPLTPGTAATVSSSHTSPPPTATATAATVIHSPSEAPRTPASASGMGTAPPGGFQPETTPLTIVIDPKHADPSSPPPPISPRPVSPVVLPGPVDPPIPPLTINVNVGPVTPRGGGAISPVPFTPGADLRRGNNDVEEDTGFTCNGCEYRIKGVRYRCLDAMCSTTEGYDLCSDCIKLGVHPLSHKMLKIERPESNTHLEEDSSESAETNSVTIGLKVYAKRECEVEIRGQLRQGQLLHHFLTLPKLL